MKTKTPQLMVLGCTAIFAAVVNAQSVSNTHNQTNPGSLIANTANSRTMLAPSYSVGDSWMIRESNLWTNKLIAEHKLSVVGVMGDFHRVEIETRTPFANGAGLELPKTSERTLRNSNNVIHTYNDKNTSFTKFDWPLSVGKKWQYSFISTTGIHFTCAAEVEKAETLTVGNQAVPTLKVVHTVEWEQNKVKGKSLWVYWYSDAVKNVVKSTAENFAFDGSPAGRTIEQTTSFEVSQ
jgi:hypothetical protein